MARPFPHPRTGVFYFRQKVPADLRHILGNKIVSRSLRTKDPATAKLRNVEEVRKQALIWERHRKSPEPIPHKQIVALSGVVYQDYMAMLDAEPGDAGIWTEVLALLDRVKNDPTAAEPWYGPTVDNLLLENGIVTDAASRQRLIVEVERAFRQAAEQHQKRAEGDYSPDPKAARFPALGALPVPAAVAGEGISIRALFKLWERDHLAEGKSARTVGDFRHKVEALIDYLGHDDPQRVTPENIADWCDHLRHEKKLAAKTVGQKYLAVVKVVFALAVEKRKLKVNPAKENKVRYSKPIKTRPAGFTDAEANVILKAALADPDTLGRRAAGNKRAIRWAPWICAFTGARIVELMQLRTEDLIEEHGVLCLRITPEAGSVKSGNYRMVPIHPQLLEMGLPRMIRSLENGPVFCNMKPIRGKIADPVERAQSVGAKVGTWVREIAGITDPALQPNHAWRHRFKTMARDYGIDMEVRDAIQGHEDGRAASNYGEVSIRAMWNAIQRLPRFEITAG
ncbi:site-specific integrase [Falsirhodobacter xinxiangensis]|uniref:site-specific integrase n=1 Tax=Falsirhodobacter xinxiangensis TaxID=2530049 RepID=UPI001C6FD41F|nr:site-specific integrase [Rhodobacter xinxiangensis]